MGPLGLTVLCPVVPPIASMAQSDRVLQCPYISYAFPPSASSLVLSARACFPCSATRPVFSLSSGEPPTTSWIFKVRYSYPALIFINPAVDLRVHWIVHLAQDRFPDRSSGRLRLGKAAKGVAPVPSSESKYYAPAKRCGVVQYLG